MPEMTDPNMAEALRYRANKEGTERVASDEERIQDIADYIMATTAEFDSDQLRATFSDIANEMTTNKAQLAKGVPQMPEEPLPAEPAPPMPPMGGDMPMGGMPIQ
jgi:hypothetical protein